MNQTESKYLGTIKENYKKRLEYYQVNGKELSRFAWSENKKNEIYIIKASKDDEFTPELFLFFAVSSNSDSLIFKDLFNKTHGNFSFEQLQSREQQLSWIFSKGYIKVESSAKIHSSSINAAISGNGIQKYMLKIWPNEWVDKEYKSTNNILNNPTPLQTFPTTNKKFFIDRYHFNEMLLRINDDQFTDEFNQCLFAYEQSKWFLCASGLGSCLEHMMLLTLTNYSKQQNLGRNPTAKDYLKAFTREPILIDSRQQTFIDTLFRVRNSVNHHNSGHTQKNLCDMLLDGISDIFNDYFIPSSMFKNSSES